MNAPVEIGQVLADRYRIERVVGEGGMGVVVLATHLILDQRVALKFLRREVMADAGAVERFVSEARAAAQVQADSVVRVHDVAALDDGTPYIVMEFIDGADLGTILDPRGALTVEEAITYAFHACQALVETHEAGIVHGDLKPENLIVTRAGDGGRVKLLDFGLSKAVQESGVRSSRISGGTPAYMAPEQHEGRPADERTDIWAMGVVLYELLAGAPPFGVGDPSAIAARARGESPAPIVRPDVPIPLQSIVRRCLEKSPAHRFATARELAAALEPLLPPETARHRIVRSALTSVPATNTSRTAVTMLQPARRKRERVVAVVASVALAASVAAIVLWLVPQPSTRGAAATAASSSSVTTAVLPIPLGATETPAPPSAVSPPIPAATASADEAAESVPPAPSPSAIHLRRPRVPRPPSAEGRTPVATPETAPSGDRFGTRK